MKVLSLAVLLATVSTAAFAAENRYVQTNIVANDAKFNAELATDKRFINAWGIAIRPAGAGGHFWVTAKDISYEYVGDVKSSPDKKLHKMFQDELKEVKLPIGGEEAFATGTAFNGSAEHFVITQKVDGAEDITAPAKFLFASDGGIISAWTERKKADGSFDHPNYANNVIDQSKEGAQFFGLALNKNYDTLYVADFGAAPAIKVFDGKFQPADIKFDMPFDENKNGKVDAGEYAPFNVQTFGDKVLVAYAKTQPCPAEEVKAGSCKKGELFVGEEDISKPGLGKVAEFTEEGDLVAVWKDGGKLSAPWGFAYAPADFGALSNTLLVSNFGDGTIAGYDAKTRKFVDYLRDEKGNPIKIDKIWGILFGNGASLGDSNALYFAAGPDDEREGLFGSLRVAK